MLPISEFSWLWKILGGLSLVVLAFAIIDSASQNRVEPQQRSVYRPEVDERGRKTIGVPLTSFAPPREKAQPGLWSGLQDRSSYRDPHVMASWILEGEVNSAELSDNRLRYQVFNINFAFSEELQSKALIFQLGEDYFKIDILAADHARFDTSTGYYLFLLGGVDRELVFVATENDENSEFAVGYSLYTVPIDPRAWKEAKAARVESRIAEEQILVKLAQIGIPTANGIVICEHGRGSLLAFLGDALGEGVCD